MGTNFDPAISGAFDGQIQLLNDPRETVRGIALKYLGYSLNTTSESELNEAKDLLAATSSRLAAFNTDSADEFLTSGETVIGHGYSGDMFVQFLDQDNYEDYVYFVPEEGGTKWIDNMAIPFDAPTHAQHILSLTGCSPLSKVLHLLTGTTTTRLTRRL